MINTEMVPIEENLRRFLVDVVRRCQSTVAEGFRVARVPRRISVNTRHSSSHATSPLPPRGGPSLSNSQLLAPTIADTTACFFEEPPHVSVESGTSPRPPESTDRREPSGEQFTDSAYGGSLEACDCNCHPDTGTDSSIYGLLTPW